MASVFGNYGIGYHREEISPDALGMTAACISKRERIICKPNYLDRVLQEGRVP